MQESKHNGLRILVVLVLFFGALWIIFSPVVEQGLALVSGKPTQPLKQYDSLKRGIDMVGGTSLVYGVKKDPAALVNPDLASEVRDALKLRVDPNGVKNLIWRPQGDSQLEIQMPASANAAEIADQRKKLRDKMILAEDALKATNIDRDKVIEAIEHKEKDRNGISQADLPALASDSAVRQALFTKLKDLWNNMHAARQAGDAKNWARLQAEFQGKLARKGPSANGDEEQESADESQTIESTNLPVGQLDEILTSTEPKAEDLDDAKVRKTKIRADALDQLKKRFGVFPSRVKAIDDFVTAYTELSTSQASLDDATDLKRLLRGAGVLEYHIVANEVMPPADYAKYVSKLKADGPRVHPGDEAKWFEVDPTREQHGGIQEYNKKFYLLAFITPSSDGKRRSIDSHETRPWHLTNALGTTNQQSAERVVSFTFDPQGAVYMGELTAANLQKPMAIVLDDKIISVATIQAVITSSGQITGGGKTGFTAEQQDYLASTLKGGSLPAALTDEPISERTVGPQLGQANLHAGLIACILGLAVVAVFLCGYYFTAGVVATGAVIMNVIFVLAVMSALGATFTLPSIAGIVLSVGTAVDANVLIFERLREEQHRGLSLRLALRNAYGKAFSAIVDSNMTTAITSIALIMFGTEEVKGFGVTLIIGIIASLFTALFVTRTVFDLLIDKFGVRHLRSVPLVFPKWDRMLCPKFDWIGKTWWFAAFSAVGIVVGITLFIIKAQHGEILGIEFASGTSVQFETAKPIKQAELQTLIDERIKEKNVTRVLPAFAVVAVGTDDKVYEFVTPNSDAVSVRDAILGVLVDKDGKTLLKVDVPSKFDGAGQPTADLVKHNIVIPLEDGKTPDAKQWANGFRPEEFKDFQPGVAIVLDHLDPPLTMAQISDRMKQLQLQLPKGSTAARLEFKVLTPGITASGQQKPSEAAVILCRNAAPPYSTDPAGWHELLADPLWQLVKDSVNRPAQLQQVKNFDPQVAKDAVRAAMLAVILSIITIMVYIWFRFGNFKYATATMIGLLHDVLFTIGAIGFAHYLWQVPILGKVFQLEAFRIDLTVVAAILATKGYSMMDKIVVFDRIRENRGKFGLETPQLINDAINQTLSRTLLTAGTNVVTVAIMYFLGGPGIHGFTFVLLIGILVGTYSSVAIAAPILLLGKHRVEEGNKAGGAMRPARA